MMKSADSASQGNTSHKSVDYWLELVQNEPTVQNYIMVARKIEPLIIDRAEFKKVKIAILRSFTIEPILPYLKVQCYQNK